MQQNVHCTCHYLSLQHLQACVRELVEGQRGLDEIDTVDHVGGHVHRVEAAGRHGAHLQQGIDHARQNLHGKHTEGISSTMMKHKHTGLSLEDSSTVVSQRQYPASSFIIQCYETCLTLSPVLVNDWT